MKRVLKLLTVALVLMSASALAQVIVNAQLYHGASLIQPQQQYGDIIPPGNYWLLQNGNWGYAGSSQIEGNFYTDNQGIANSGQSAYPISEPVVDSMSRFCARNGCSILW